MQPRLSQASITVTLLLHGKRAGGGPSHEPDVTGGSENLPPRQGEDRAAADGRRYGEQVTPAVRGEGLAELAGRKRPGLPPELPAPGGTLDGIRPLSAADP